MPILKSLLRHVIQPIVPLAMGCTCIIEIFYHFGWRPAIPALIAAVSAVVWDRWRSAER